MKIPTVYLIAGGMLAVAVGYAVIKSKGSGMQSIAGDLGYSVGTAAFNAVDGVFAGVVLNTGDALGIPRTNMTECERAKAEGRTWDASFACPAKEFLSYVFS
ncbi:hypothetical protein [Oxalicibacterium faecigallinarum]|uniref:Uncharacterized protein n=1 Tax=Oxalicibacterium faecigallinarum TaxID=573741 RepID=A0A8J3AN77_9BURK|nr:hypothetical protein [Oxalicibacterium faecigallinarum]GGI16885.1 hypothetical protein GCM10008066_06200 [Oxalicibacterium faecigallinarum]